MQGEEESCEELRVLGSCLLLPHYCAPVSGMHLGNGVTWVHECFPEVNGHLHVSVYLIETPHGHILIDSGSFYHRDSLADRINHATRGQGIGALILSHSDYPHSGNIPSFRTEWGDFDIVASCADPEIQGLPYARRVRIGETVDVLGRRFTILDPPLADRSHTTWVFDEESSVLFVADGFGTLHQSGECHTAWGELPTEGRGNGVADFHEQTLPWVRYADPDRLMDSLRAIFDRHEASWVAPIHGPPIAARDLGVYLDNLDHAVRNISKK